MKFELKLVARFACAFALALALGGASSFAQKAWKKKEKHFEPVARPNVKDYAGRYVGIEDSYWVELRVGEDGRLAGTYTEDGRSATLEDIRVEGATLTATRVYANGRRAELVATFADRVLNGERAFGLLVENVSIELPGMTLTRIFYRRVAE